MSPYDPDPGPGGEPGEDADDDGRDDEGEDTFELPGLDGWDEPEPQRWPLDWRALYPRERWVWFERLWTDVCMLRDRYRLPVRSRWWEDGVQVEALAAMAAWTARYDSGEWDDPPGKLNLLYELERLEAVLRDGNEPFRPERDRLAFAHHLAQLGCQPPPATPDHSDAR